MKSQITQNIACSNLPDINWIVSHRYNHLEGLNPSLLPSQPSRRPVPQEGGATSLPLVHRHHCVPVSGVKRLATGPAGLKWKLDLSWGTHIFKLLGQNRFTAFFVFKKKKSLTFILKFLTIFSNCNYLTMRLLKTLDFHPRQRKILNIPFIVTYFNSIPSTSHKNTEIMPGLSDLAIP